MSAAAQRPFADLVARARAGQTTALDALVQRFGERLMLRVRLMLGEDLRRRAESVDYLQGLFTQVVAELPRARIEDERHFLAWATRIARNDLRDELRKRREHAFESFSASLAAPQQSSPSPPSEVALDEQRERVLEALERLDDRQRTVLELRHFEGLTFREAGERMGCSEGAAQMLHTRALARLGRYLPSQSSD